MSGAGSNRPPSAKDRREALTAACDESFTARQGSESEGGLARPSSARSLDHGISVRLPLSRRLAHGGAGWSADVREPQEAEGLRLEATGSAVLAGEAPERNDPGLLGMQLQPEPVHLWLGQEAPGMGRWCFGQTPIQTFLDAIPLAQEKMIAA